MDEKDRAPGSDRPSLASAASSAQAERPETQETAPLPLLPSGPHGIHGRLLAQGPAFQRFGRGAV